MNVELLKKFWPLMYSIVREFWEITEPQIESAAVENDIPIELYYYSELGRDYFSLEGFQKRDPFTNPEQFEKAFARFDVKGWIIPVPDDRYQVSRRAREAMHAIIHAGDEQLAGFDRMPDPELIQLALLLKRLTTANLEAPEPPEKWAIVNRLRMSDEQSPLIVQIRENLMEMFAYRDDSHLTAARPHFGQAGNVWDVLGAILHGSAVNAGQMAEKMSFRGYEEAEYEVAIQAAVEIGWVEATVSPNTFSPTSRGREIREQVENLTDEYFYRSWQILSDKDLDDLYTLLTRLHAQLSEYKKALLDDSRL